MRVEELSSGYNEEFAETMVDAVQEADRENVGLALISMAMKLAFCLESESDPERRVELGLGLVREALDDAQADPAILQFQKAFHGATEH